MLSAYSSQGLVTLLDLLPNLQSFVTIHNDYFEIQLIAPAGWDFWVSSAENEITVGFAEYHTHFGWHEGNPMEDATEAAAFIQTIRSGKQVLAIWYEGDKYVSSRPVEMAESAQPKTCFQRWWRRKQTLVIKKWAG